MLVKQLHMHGPCGDDDPNCVCMKDGKCIKGFKKNCYQVTKILTGTYPYYRRRCKYFVIKKQIKMSDEYVVPYNIKLLLKYECHLNIEICSNFEAKYHEGQEK